ncbi:MAG: tRNA (adenosine(37)-N6)-threonylcarbamoyltransferase complex transferase subunit TsaD [Bacteroidota bacterium]|nr:tRNA (adenosine(37)-N6)-threonylcarbamoyltransferase complex transferase subunit TsaD [Bacteroidota bacterium]MDP4215317.1 tRNA (adenosine(37)-N6)-threonylcarbamoyltransferase complex transferase subunit TsaD [Bacteroidota bacterium]MDP4245014.1 tRNA (adenosine(37)-N6)-threonylcarbamoyltransferase complex transferase subunit TsaD [Bacteroidota bacterium]MDP4252880.1 tRNA (adenosine(37)-N6)-threonylcarbamoyltransferase complex transferase subunit TsaD [Bacteroidota bacterium]MDP4259131.1 tRNA
MPVILAIESSCDETACAICRDGQILSNIIAGQAIHEQYGGVVPELASRAHLQNIVPVVDAALKKAAVGLPEVDAIAFTESPGLIGSLLVGSQFAKSLALSLNIPLLAVHHMQAHVLANLIPRPADPGKGGSQGVATAPMPSFPFLCLTVSGGHTQIVLCEAPLVMRVIGETLDDAAGEAFDKSAKLLGLPYPGGPLIDRHAQGGSPDRFPFPEPQIPGLNFSFSGLKTSILYFLQSHLAADPEFIRKNLPDICASIQHRIISILLNKLHRATRETGVRDLCLAGGVSANSGLRKAFYEAGRRHGWNTFIPPFEYCTDNAAMIAIAGHYKYLAREFSPMTVSASARAQW